MTPNNKFKFKDMAQARSAFLAAINGSEKRFDTPYYVEGYAAKYEPYLLYEDNNGRVFERFDPGCFMGCDMSDVILQFDHAGRVFARTTNNTLIVEPDDIGLFMAADLSRSDKARELHADVAEGLLTKMSWRFKVGEYHVEETRGSNDITIVHTSVPKIYDVSVVSIPANNDTEINCRSLVDGVIAERTRREVEAEEIRTRMRMKLKLLEVVK